MNQNNEMARWKNSQIDYRIVIPFSGSAFVMLKSPFNWNCIEMHFNHLFMDRLCDLMGNTKKDC